MTERPGPGGPAPEADVPLTVLGVRVELPEQHHVILLLDPSGDTVLPLWVGAGEASAAAMALEGVVPPRPMPHDLLLSTVAALGHGLERVRLTGVHDDVVHAELVLTGGTRVDARASDAVALALRAEVPVLCAADVLRVAGLSARDSDEAGDERQLEDFRDFLDAVRPEDFG